MNGYQLQRFTAGAPLGRRPRPGRKEEFAMKCPYCHVGMEQGYLQGMRRVAWVKSRHNFSLLPKPGEVLLGNNAFKDFFIPSRIFKKCRKMMVDYSDWEVQEG